MAGHPTTTNATGKWSLRQVAKYESDGLWPSIPLPTIRSVVSWQTSGVSPATLPMPSGIAVGDLMMVYTVSSKYASEPEASLSTTGWTQVKCDWTNYTYESSTWYKIATSSDVDGTLTITHSSTSATYTCGFVVAVKDAGASPTISSSVDISIPSTSSTGDRNIGVPPTAVSGGLMLAFVGDRSGGNVYQTTGNFTLLSQDEDGSNGTIYQVALYSISSDDYISGGFSEYKASLSSTDTQSYDAASIMIQVNL